MPAKPNAFVAKASTGPSNRLSHWLPQPLQLALPLPISSPHQRAVLVPARAAYSHSASLGNRYGLLPPISGWAARARVLIQAVKASASFQSRHTAGQRGGSTSAGVA